MGRTPRESGRVLVLAVALAAALIWAAFLFFTMRRLDHTAEREREDNLAFELRAAAWSDRHVGSLLARNPRSPTLLGQHVSNAADRSDWPEALRRAELFVARAPRSPHAWLAHIDVLHRAGRAEDAAALLRQALRRMPRQPDIQAAWGQEAMRQKDWAEAARRYGRLRRRWPERPDGYEQAANALLEEGRPNEADALIAEGMRRTKHWPLWHAAAKLAENVGDLEEAIRRWEAMRADHPAVSVGFLRGAEALAQAGRGEAATALVLQARDFFPGDKAVADAAARLAPAEASAQPGVV